jgi:hypothetical protein
MRQTEWGRGATEKSCNNKGLQSDLQASGTLTKISVMKGNF